MTERAEATDQPLSSVSRWLRRLPGIRLVEHPDDARAKVVEAVDMEGLLAYLIPLLEEWETMRLEYGPLLPVAANESQPGTERDDRPQRWFSGIRQRRGDGGGASRPWT